MRNIFNFFVLAVLLTFFIMGCSGKIPSDAIVRGGAETATVLVLTEAAEDPVTERDVNRAESVQLIAINIQDYLDPSEPIDPEALKALIIQMVMDQLDSQKDRLVITLLINNVTTLVFAELDDKGLTWSSPEDDVKELIVAAAEGVESGATLWLAVYAEDVEGGE